MSNKAKTEETRRDGELMLDELEAVSGGSKYNMRDVSVSSQQVGASGQAVPSEALSL